MTTLGQLVVTVIILIPILIVGVYLATRPEATPAGTSDLVDESVEEVVEDEVVSDTNGTEASELPAVIVDETVPAPTSTDETASSTEAMTTQ